MDITQNAHGTSGPLQKGLPIWTSGVSEHFIEAMQSLGVPHNGDNARPVVLELDVYSPDFDFTE